MRRAMTIHILLAALTSAMMGACTKVKSPAPKGKPLLVVTTSMLADMVRTIAGEDADVVQLMGPGVDPHLYKATLSDIEKLRTADVIFYNGLHLEGTMQTVLEQVQKQGRRVIAVAEALSKSRLIPVSDGVWDPHVWFDVSLWMELIPVLSETIAAAAPDGKAQIVARATALTERLRVLEDWVRAEVARVPVPSRTLVTSHDAFSYFGRAYGFKVIGLQGISTVSEAGLFDVESVIKLVKEQAVRAVFAESSVSRRAIEQVSRATGVTIGGELFSDATGTPGKRVDGVDEGSYEGMIRHNVKTIVGALSRDSDRSAK